MHMARPKPIDLALILQGLAQFVTDCSVAGKAHCVSKDTKNPAIARAGWSGDRNTTTHTWSTEIMR